MKKDHSSLILNYKGKEVDIDEKMVPIIEWCWSNNIDTCYCCQGKEGKGSIFDNPYIAFNSLDDFEMFAEKISEIVPTGERLIVGQWVLTLLLKDGDKKFKVSCYMPNFNEILKYI